MKKINPLIVPIIVLSVLFFVCLFFGEKVTLQDFLSNISVEILGIIITLLVIDLYFRLQERKEAKKREEIVWRTIRPILAAHLSLLFSLYKSTREERGENYETRKLQNFLSGDFSITIRSLDIRKDAPIYPISNWATHLAINIIALNEKYDNILDKYSTYMPHELIDTLEKIKESYFHSVLSGAIPTVFNLSSQDKKSIPSNIFETLLSQNEIKNYTDNLTYLLKQSEEFDFMNDFYSISNENWREDIAPKIGSGR